MNSTQCRVRRILTAFMTMAFISPGAALAVEEAEYALVLQDDAIEIRDYAAQIVAETRVEGDMKGAGNTAFGPLFGYIGGDNETQASIAMTAPVAQRESESEKIAMTAPVGQRAEGESWVVSFMMPASYSMETIPMPTDPRVSLREIPPQRMAVIRYSGRWTEKNYGKQLEALREWMSSNGLEAVGDPLWARYNAPFSLPFMRRNEILLPLAEDALPTDQ